MHMPSVQEYDNEHSLKGSEQSTDIMWLTSWMRNITSEGNNELFLINLLKELFSFIYFCAVIINSNNNVCTCVTGMYKRSLVPRSRKLSCLLNLPTGWFHSECLFRCLLPLLSSFISPSGSSAEQSKNSSSSDSTN
jgi:hypothetical protein